MKHDEASLLFTITDCLKLVYYVCLLGLVELTLSANPGISTQGWTRFFIGLAASSTLRTLNLDYNTIGDFGAGCLAVTLASNNSLETLDLEGTGITEFGAQVRAK